MSDQSDAPEPAAPGNGEGSERVILRQIVLTQYANGDFSIGAPKSELPIVYDLQSVLGLLEYAKRWVNLQWELGELSMKMDVTRRIAAEDRSRVVPITGSAAPAFFGGKARH